MRPVPIGTRECRGDALFGKAMILLNHVVQVRTPLVPAPTPKFVVALQFSNGARIRLVAVDVDDAWTNPGDAAQRQLQKELRSNRVTRRRQQEIDSVAGSTARYKEVQ